MFLISFSFKRLILLLVILVDYTSEKHNFFMISVLDIHIP
jgi:hypothetical protein